jgi:hypothetical protein
MSGTVQAAASLAEGGGDGVGASGALSGLAPGPLRGRIIASISRSAK